MKNLKVNFFVFILLGLSAFFLNALDALNGSVKSVKSKLVNVVSVPEESIITAHDLRRFEKNRRRLLPRWKKEFQIAAAQNKLPWPLIAAIAYQESHWDPAARSYTGVRGLMQLTEDTAEHMGVTDRKDPQQSIWGGARYIKYLFDLTSPELAYEERINLALTAYNLGWGHLLDAQSLAEKRGLNPGSWIHLQTILPLLSNPTYASQLQHGKARGEEAQEFVTRVRAYEKLLRR